ncbi:MAG: hypothetical protein JSV52_09265 [Candidatus Zixiibacteriota bacterium]|nr:MAG: hypothetical protein JSV52_09265 [candidate division Zixibacteria bacterium]
MKTQVLKYKSVLLCFFLYFSLGNVLRLIPMASAVGSVNTIEIALHCYCLIVLILSLREASKFPAALIVVYMCFFVSYMLGAVRVQEMDVIALTYNIRILLFFTSSYVIGLSLYRIFHHNLTKLLHFHLSMFLFNVACAWIIYFVFPDSTKLWAFLASYGITFNGDPHVHRLLGTLFDPNFLGNLLILPVLYCLYLYDTTQKKRYLGVLTLLILAEFFTFSRSSLLGLSLGLILYFAPLVKRSLFALKVRKSLAYNLVILILGLIGFLYFLPGEAQRIAERFIFVSQDNSAAQRVHDLALGLSLLTEGDIFVFGIGFNFFTYLGVTTSSLIDSSLLSMMVTLGVPVFCIVVGCLYYFFKTAESPAAQDQLFFRGVFLNYIVVSLVISNVNNLLLYPFWVLCVFPIVCYFHLLKNERIDNAVCN